MKESEVRKIVREELKEIAEDENPGAVKDAYRDLKAFISRRGIPTDDIPKTASSRADWHEYKGVIMKAGISNPDTEYPITRVTKLSPSGNFRIEASTNGRRWPKFKLSTQTGGKTEVIDYTNFTNTEAFVDYIKNWNPHY